MAIDLPYPKFLVYSMSPKVQILKQHPKALIYILAFCKPIHFPTSCLFFVFSVHCLFHWELCAVCCQHPGLPFSSVIVSDMPLLSLQFQAASGSVSAMLLLSVEVGRGGWVGIKVLQQVSCYHSFL